MLCFLFQFGLQQRNVKLAFTLFTHPRLIVTVYIYIRSSFDVIVVLCGEYTPIPLHTLHQMEEERCSRAEES